MTINAATLALAATDAGAATMLTSLATIRTALEADAIVVVEHIDNRLIRVTHLDTADGHLSAPVTTEIPDHVGIDIDVLIAMSFSRRYVGAPVAPAPLLVGPELTARFPVLQSLGSLASIPVGSRGDALVAVARRESRPWKPEAIDALATFGAFVGELSGRRVGQQQTARRERAHEDMAEWSCISDTLTEDLGSAALEEVLAQFGASQGLIAAEIVWGPNAASNCLPDCRWHAAGEDRDFGSMTSSAPIGTDDEPFGLLSTTWRAEAGPPYGVRLFAGILHRLEGRLRQERHAAEVSRVGAAIAAAAVELVAASNHTFPVVLPKLLKDIGAVLEVDALAGSRSTR